MKEGQAWLSEEMAVPLKPGELEEEGYARGFTCIAGLDEVGRGPLAGPVVAAAVVLPRGVAHPDIKDSKLLSAKQREVLAAWIKDRAAAWAIGSVGPDEIEQMNILRASLLAMSHAFGQLRPAPDLLLLDGPHKIPLDFLRRVQEVQQVQNDLDGLKRYEQMPSQRAIKKGDRLCLSIGAASIVAKVARDQMMMEYDQLYPEYGFAQHKGYGSARHLAALRRYGASPIHRRGFRTVRECVGPTASRLPSLVARKLEG